MLPAETGLRTTAVITHRPRPAILFRTTKQLFRVRIELSLYAHILARVGGASFSMSMIMLMPIFCATGFGLHFLLKAFRLSNSKKPIFHRPGAEDVRL